MPGVYVRGIGKSDRTGTREAQQPTLNVPGSYWLSHKQNIYKFAFKYHESTRDTKEFLYKDELMKVIKRIIKCQPNQGRLSTVHLSITYKHTFWTRQDKMFAMLKFRNSQDAVVFPQAFILTISFVNNPESQINTVVIKSDPNLSFGASSTVQLLQNSADLSSAEELNENNPRQTQDNKNFHRNLNRSYSSNEPNDPTTVTVDTIVYQQSFTSTNSDGLLNISPSLESPTTSWTKNRRRKRSRDTWTSSSQCNPTERYNDSKLGDNSTNIIVGNSQNASLQDLRAEPYSACHKISNSRITVDENKDTEKRKLGEMGLCSEPITPRSSNITNQVMEGLMFTIKQVEDNVKVVEQKTKMELDEVLENSEKVETKEGERCLVNSSLLRLENLVTKIEMPGKQLKDPKITDIAPTIDSLTLHNGLSTTGCLPNQPVVEEQASIPIRYTSRSPFRSSLKSNWKNHIGDESNKLSTSTDELVPIKLMDSKLADKEESITKEFHNNLIGQRKRKYISHGIHTEESKDPAAIENSIIENFNGSSIGSENYDDNDNDKNNNNNKNNDSHNTTNQEVQIDMWKLLQDITRGAKVMIERISEIDIRNATRPSSISVPRAKIVGRRKLSRRRNNEA